MEPTPTEEEKAYKLKLSAFNYLRKLPIFIKKWLKEDKSNMSEPYSQSQNSEDVHSKFSPFSG